ncbi:MAG: amidohydrolase, partial [Sphingomicrobium sp.]
MRTSLIAATTLLLAAVSTTAMADTLIDNANGIQVDAKGRLQRFNGLIVGDDGRVVRLLAQGDRRPLRMD